MKKFLKVKKEEQKQEKEINKIFFDRNKEIEKSW